MSIKQFRNLALSLLVLCACSKEKLDEDGFKLYYPDVVEIAQNITVNLSPTWKGGTPSDFAITKVTFEDAFYSGPEFTINSTTGLIAVAGQRNTMPGDYIISISCNVNGQQLYFPDKVKVSFVNGIPEGISMSPEEFLLNIADLAEDSPAELPTAQVVTEGDHIKIETYTIRNVKKDGVLVDNVTKPMFAISNTGVISVIKGGPFEVGTYTLDLKLTTRSYSNESQVGLFPDAVAIRVCSAPKALTYSPDVFKLDEETAERKTWFESTVPVLTGSVEGLEYSLKSNPETDKISINPQTGVIRVEEGHGFHNGDTYSVDVYVKNDFTDEPVCFKRAVTLEIVDFIPEVSDFVYAPVSKKMVLGWSVDPQPADNGAYVYEFAEPDADYVKYLSLDRDTGKISAEKGNKLPVGTYEIKVAARNAKYQSLKTVVCNLTVTENPYYFTYFSYGNNLGLSETATAGVSQFRVTSAEELLSLDLNVKYSDLSQGTPVSYSRSVKRQLKNTNIDASTGHLIFAEDGYVAQTMGIVFVTAKTQDPEDASNSFSVTMPVFIDFSGVTEGVSVQYNPFVLRFNPKEGGRSVVPVITCADPAKFYLDFRRDFCYYNIDGQRSDGTAMESGALSTKSPSCPFLEHLWVKYGTDNYGAKLPVAYWNGDKLKTAEELAKAPCYVDGAAGVNQYSVVANRGLWYDDGWADGVFIGQMTFADAASGLGGAPTSQRIVPLALWIDKDYLE